MADIATLQARIAEEYYGELPVGSAILIETNSNDIRYMISAPTMRVPIDIRGTFNPYFAFRAVLVSILRHNKTNCNDQINSVLCPGLGTLTGRINIFI